MIDPVVALWSMIIAACLTLGSVHFLVWVSNRRSSASLAVVGFTVAVGSMAAFELNLMLAPTAQAYAELQRWAQLPIVMVVFSMVFYVRAIFGRAWEGIGLAAIAARALTLVPNFLSNGSLNYTELHALRKVEFLGSLVAAPIGEPSNWSRLAELSSLLLLAYIVLAAYAHGRRDPGQRRRAVLIGGTLALFVLCGAGLVAIVHRGYVHLPYIASLLAMAVTAMMTYDISRDLLRVSNLTSDLAEIRQHTELATSAAGVGLWSLVLGNGAPWANPIARAMHCVGAHDPLQFHRVLERIHPDDRGAVEVTLRVAINRLSEFEVDYRIQTGPDTWRWIEARGAVERDATGRARVVRGISLDISERSAAEERFRMVVESAPNAMLAFDTARRIMLASRQAEAMFRCERYALLGRNVDELIAGLGVVGPPGPTGSPAQLPQTGAIGAGRELNARRMDGSDFIVGVGLSPIDAPHEPLVLAYLVDLTPRLQHERELLQLREQFANVARISMAGQLATTLAHEINQPLGAILRNAEAAGILLASDTPQLGEIAEILADIRSDDQRAGAIIDHMRSLLRRKQPELSVVSLATLVERLLASLRHDVDARHQAFDVLIPDDLQARADPMLLSQVLMNLMTNAIDAMQHVPAQTRRLVINARERPRDTIELTVADTGPGVAPATLARIFEPFFSTKGEGMGMGLAICRSLLESMDATIEVDNRVGGGAVFRILLPSARAAKVA